MGVKSVDQVFEIQSQYAKKAFDTYLPRCRSSVRCMWVWRATLTPLSSKPPLRPPTRQTKPLSRSLFDRRPMVSAAGLFLRLRGSTR